MAWYLCYDYNTYAGSSRNSEEIDLQIEGGVDARLFAISKAKTVWEENPKNRYKRHFPVVRWEEPLPDD